MTSLGKNIAARTNNLNAIRLILALAVILSHAFPLSLGLARESVTEPLSVWTRHQESFGSLAVDLFFLISGMLITASWLRSRSMQDFLMKRVLRIYPGFIVAVTFSSVIIWTLCPEFRAHAGHGLSWLMAMCKDWIFLTYKSLSWSGIFAQNPLPDEANLSLWTIPREFACYLFILCLGLFYLFKHRRLIALMGLVVFLDYLKLQFTGHDVIQIDCRFATYFLAGINAWLWREKIPFSIFLAIGCTILLVVTSQFKPFFSSLFPLAGSYILLWLGFGPIWHFMQWTEKTDLSYGVYLYAFPVQQIVAMCPAMRVPLLSLLVSVPATLCLAWFSWHLVESRFLKLKSKDFSDHDPGQPLAAPQTY